jgi:hypothetical protein
MAFVRTVELTHDLEATLFIGNIEYVWQLAIGYDDQSDSTISLLACLSPVPGGMLEFVFNVVEADSGNEYKYWDGLATKVKMPRPEDRAIALDLICRAIAPLVKESRAEEILCSTHTPDLPDGAVRKFLVIMEAFRRCGYNATEQEPSHGYRAWIIRRST